MRPTILSNYVNALRRPNRSLNKQGDGNTLTKNRFSLLNCTNQTLQISIGSYQDYITPFKEDYNIDKLDKLHLQNNFKTSITRVSILTLKFSPCYRRVGECCVDLKINKTEHKMPKYSLYLNTKKGYTKSTRGFIDDVHHY